MCWTKGKDLKGAGPLHQKKKPLIMAFWRCSKDRQLSVTKMAQVKQVTSPKGPKATKYSVKSRFLYHRPST
jgi:hypothetical protein